MKKKTNLKKAKITSFKKFKIIIMNNEEKLKKIIAAYTPFDYTQINLSIEIKDRYIALELKDNFANDICNAWPKVDCTHIHNEMFASLKTGNNILEFLNK
jgi:hypothetical protein